VSQPVRIPSGTITLLFTDVEGSTKLWETEPELMAQALRRHDEILRAAIEQAVAHQLLVPDGTHGYAFRHALLREAIYADLLSGERTRLHARLAGLLSCALTFNEGRADVDELVAAWVQGYRQVEPLSREDEAEIATFLMLRRLMLSAYMVVLDGCHHGALG
jgi:class 3 adenylate cyclase